ncbi:MAG TPA: VOC family protein [Candidatus Angelobacter sp.]|jgi:catechol 2,3-dioxygenase-like lactoylglutathione lyase family enzyme
MPDSVQISRIAAIMLGVRDLPAAIAFYKDKLGLKVVMQEPALALLQCGNIMLGLSPRHMNAAPLAEAVEVSFGVDSLRATHKALGEKGVVFLSEPRAVTPMDWAVHFRDVDGHLLSLFGPEGKA